MSRGCYPQEVPDIDLRYIEFPFGVKADFGKGRSKSARTFDGLPYDLQSRHYGRLKPVRLLSATSSTAQDIRLKIGKLRETQ
jgi:hypothetical protein